MRAEGSQQQKRGLEDTDEQRRVRLKREREEKRIEDRQIIAEERQERIKEMEFALQLEDIVLRKDRERRMEEREEKRKEDRKIREEIEEEERIRRAEEKKRKKKTEQYAQTVTMQLHIVE